MLYSRVPVFLCFCNQIPLRLPLSPLSLLLLCRTPPPLPGQVRRPATSAPLRILPRATPTPALQLPTPRWHLPARPRCAPPARADPRRRSPSQRLPRHLLPSNAPRVMPQLRRRLPGLVLACPCASTLRSFCPSAAAIATHAVYATAPATTWSRLVPEPEHVLESLIRSISCCTHTFSLCSFALTATSHQTSVVPLDHRRPAPTLLLNPNPVQL
jgi:hypothetical protein